MPTRIKKREGASRDLYSSNIFLSKEVAEKINHLLQNFGELDIPEDFSAREGGDVFTDEISVLNQYDRLDSEGKSRTTNSHAQDVRAFIEKQRALPRPLLFAPDANHRSIQYFLSLGFEYGGK